MNNYKNKKLLILPRTEESICIAEELLHDSFLSIRQIGETSRGEKFCNGEPSVRNSITGVEGWQLC